MRAFVQFDEVYTEIIFPICATLRELTDGKIEFHGIAIRRETVRKKVDAAAPGLGIKAYEWWNNIEQRIIRSDYDPRRLQFYRELLGNRNLKRLVSCCRDIGSGLLTGGFHPRTKLQEHVGASDERRWNYVVGVLDYFLETFEKLKPTFVFLNEITFPWEMGAYLIAEHLHIPCLTLCYTRSGCGYIVTNNPYQRCPQIEALYRRALQDPDVVQDQIAEAESRVDEFRNRPVLPDYSIELWKKTKRRSSLLGIVRTLGIDTAKLVAMHLGLFGTRGFLRQENWLDVMKFNLQGSLATRRALRGRGFEDASPYLDTDYLYYPLHVEPESSTLILSERLTNQFAYIEQLSRNMPAGFKLLVKEHIPMFGRRPPDFYARLRRLPDVHLVSPFEDNFKLIKNARVVCVLTGTAGWEAIMLGVPVIVVGQAQYLGIGEGFIRCENLFTLDETIRQALSLSPVPRDRVVRFVAATLKLQSSITSRAVLYWHFDLDPKKVIPEDGIKQLAEQILSMAQPG